MATKDRKEYKESKNQDLLCGLCVPLWQSRTFLIGGRSQAFGFRPSDFGFLSAFGLRVSAFRAHVDRSPSAPPALHFRSRLARASLAHADCAAPHTHGHFPLH